MKLYTSGLALAFFLLTTAAETLAGTLPSGFRRINSPTSGSYSLRYVPASLDQSRPVPVIVFLHGSGSSPEAWQDILAPIADDLTFLLVLPKSEKFLGFGPGRDDATIQETLDVLRQQITLDESRISIAGHSAGGGLCLCSGSPGPFPLQRRVLPIRPLPHRPELGGPGLHPSHSHVLRYR